MQEPRSSKPTVAERHSLDHRFSNLIADCTMISDICQGGMLGGMLSLTRDATAPTQSQLPLEGQAADCPIA